MQNINGYESCMYNVKKQSNIVINLSHWHCGIQCHFNPMFFNHFETYAKTISKHYKIWQILMNTSCNPQCRKSKVVV
jgi:hypothetical protein